MTHNKQQIIKFVILCFVSVLGVAAYVASGGSIYKAIVLYFCFGALKAIANVAYHRWLAHSYIEPGRIFRFILLYSIVAGALVRPLHYVAGHRLHHRYPDTDNDPHTPSIGFWNSLIGNFNTPHASVSVKDLYRQKDVIFVNKHFYSLYVVNLFVWFTIDPDVVYLSFLFLNIRQLISVTAFNYLGHGGQRKLSPQNLSVWHGIVFGWYGEQLHKNHHDDPSNPYYGRTSLLNFDIMYYMLKLVTKVRPISSN